MSMFPLGCARVESPGEGQPRARPVLYEAWQEPVGSLACIVIYDNESLTTADGVT